MRARRRREEPASEAAGHERWLISYADFITLLFAFFVVMYAVSSVNAGRYRVLSDALSSAFSGVKMDPVNAGPVIPTLPRAIHRVPAPALQPKVASAQQERMEDIADRFSKALTALVKDGQVRVTNTVRGVAVEISASVLFAQGQADLQPGSLPALRSIASVLAGFDDLVQVEGHTDTLPIATPQFPSNWELSSARAGAVVRFFVDQAIPPERLSAAGYSEFRPVASNLSAEGRARNRRVTLIVLPADPKESAQPEVAATAPPAAPETLPGGSRSRGLRSLAGSPPGP